jgi:glucose-6-phosphate isomerase
MIIDPIIITFLYDLWRFLEGASSIDNHFRTSSFEKNLPVSEFSMGISDVNRQPFL